MREIVGKILKTIKRVIVVKSLFKAAEFKALEVTQLICGKAFGIFFGTSDDVDALDNLDCITVQSWQHF